jgi:DNA-binding transcriptional regulator YiaG
MLQRIWSILLEGVHMSGKVEMSQLVRTLRQQLNMTQEEFAHAIGITVGTVNRWENGRFRPSKLARATLLGLAQRHGLSLDPTAPANGNGSGQAAYPEHA